MAKSGRPKSARKRVPVQLRIAPEVAAWYQRTAANQGLSRTLLIERCLARFALAVDSFGEWQAHGLPPDAVEGALGREFMTALLELGFSRDLIGEALRNEQEQYRAWMGEAHEHREKKS